MVFVFQVERKEVARYFFNGRGSWGWVGGLLVIVVRGDGLAAREPDWEVKFCVVRARWYGIETFTLVL